MAKSKFFRVATEGATTDGRVIERDWIDQMAAGYNPATYTASINCEHIAGFSPQPPFNCYGQVTALEARDFSMQLNGQTVTRRGLYAQVDANDQLVATIGQGQKLFPSVEIAPNFANTGKAGLVGLAVTDNPASLGTEIMQFAAGRGDANPFASRKKDKANLFSAVDDGVSIELEADTGKGLVDRITSAISDGFAKFTAKPPEKKEEPKPEPEAGAFDVAAFSKATTDAIAGAIKTASDSFAAQIAPLTAGLAEVRGKLASEPTGSFSRQPASGGGPAVQTDC